MVAYLFHMSFRIDKRFLAVSALGMVVCLSNGCGTSSSGSRYLMQHGVADSGYPPKGAPADAGSPALSSMGGDVSAKGVEREVAKPAPKQDIPANVAATPRT